MGWVSLIEAGIPKTTFKRKRKKGLIQWRYGASGPAPRGMLGEGPAPRRMRGGEAGKRIEVWIDDESHEAQGAPRGVGENATPQGKGRIGHSEKRKIKNHTRVHRGEPGCDVVTSIINGMPQIIQAPPSASGSEEPMARRETPSLLDPSKEPTPGGGACSNLPQPLFFKEGRNDEIPSPKALRIANFKFAILQKFGEELAKPLPETLPLFNNGNGHSKSRAIQKFLGAYNSGLLLPDIHAEIEKISRASLYNWLKLYDQGGVEGLAPQYKGPQSSPISTAEKKFLLSKLLDQNKPTIGDSINKCKFLLGEESPSSPSRLRRFVNEFRRNNHDLWVLEREGEKALNDKCVPYAEREWRDLAVGEAVVADGHKLNFQVINPFTGKPTRAIMVLFWDWKSAYPLGWEIMLTESIQCVVAALRNAVITLGKFPRHALLDNGKAFRANIFRQKFRFQDTEIPGIFDKLNITPHFAMPYNAQSKPIERFFRIFNDWFERELPSYTGASINDKPARLNRNEKRAASLHDEWVPTIPEAMELIFRWREYYSDQPSRARDGQRPRDIFEAEKGPGVDPFALHFLMMTCKARMVHRNGITFNGWHWYHENLYGLKDYVLMFYSYYDLSQVYIFSMKNEFLCVAKPVDKVKPFASDSEFPEDMAAVQRINATKAKCINLSKKLADQLQSQKDIYIDWNRKFRDQPEVAEAIEKIEESKKPKLVKYSPYPDNPPQSAESIAHSESPQEPARPRWKWDFEKYDWLMERPDQITELDQQWLKWYRSTSTRFKEISGGQS